MKKLALILLLLGLYASPASSSAKLEWLCRAQADEKVRSALANHGLEAAGSHGMPR